MQTVTLSIPNLTTAQANQVLTMVAAMGDTTTKKTKTVDDEGAPLARLATGKKGKKAAKQAPEKTISDEEDEDFGSEELEEEDLEVADDEDTDEESEEDDEESEDEEDEASLKFDEVKKAMNRFGESNPVAMKAILASFNIKNSKELEKHPKKWEPVYRKTMAKLKALKKKK